MIFLRIFSSWLRYHYVIITSYITARNQYYQRITQTEYAAFSDYYLEYARLNVGRL